MAMDSPSSEGTAHTEESMETSSATSTTHAQLDSSPISTCSPVEANPHQPKSTRWSQPSPTISMEWYGSTWRPIPVQAADGLLTMQAIVTSWLRPSIASRATERCPPSMPQGTCGRPSWAASLPAPPLLPSSYGMPITMAVPPSLISRPSEDGASLTLSSSKETPPSAELESTRTSTLDHHSIKYIQTTKDRTWVYKPYIYGYVWQRRNINKMLRLSTMLLLVFCFSLATGGYLSPSKSQSYTLGQNLILNSNISQPQIAPLTYFLYPGSINRWSTTRVFVEYISIILQTSSQFCPNFKTMPAGMQFLDTDSYRCNEEYYQEFKSTAGREFRLTFDWISQLYVNKYSLGIAIIWNGVTIDYFYDCSCKLNTATYYLISINGTNQIKLAGIGTIDSNGILIRNINIQELLYIAPPPPQLHPTSIPNNSKPQPYSKPAITQPANFWNLSNVLNDSEFSQTFAIFSSLRDMPVLGWSQRIPSLKQCLKFLFGHVLQLNHLLPYDYHLGNLTLTANIYLAGMRALDDERSYILDTYIYPLFATSPKAIVGAFQYRTVLPVKIKIVYITYEQRINSAILEMLNLLLFQIPCNFICYAIGAILFRFTFRHKISLLFRPFSIISFFIFTSINGRVETITFYCLSRLIIFGNLSFKQKSGSVFILIGYFCVFFFAISSFFLYKATNSRRLIKYLNQNCKFANAQTLHMSLSFAIYNIILGSTHALLLKIPLAQLYTLISIEGLYLIYLIIFLIRKRFANFMLGLLLCSMNGCRILLTLTHLTYQLNPLFETAVGQVQKYIFCSLGACWALSALVCFIEKGCLIVRLFYNPAKVALNSEKPNRIIIAEKSKQNADPIKPKPKQEINRTAQQNIFTSVHELVAKSKQQVQ